VLVGEEGDVVLGVQIVLYCKVLLLFPHPQVNALGVFRMVLMAMNHDFGILENSVFVQNVLLVKLRNDLIRLEPPLLHHSVVVDRGFVSGTHFNILLLLVKSGLIVRT